jgi:hypothetical protein
LHLGLDQREDEDLLIFVEEAIAIHVKNLDEVGC